MRNFTRKNYFLRHRRHCDPVKALQKLHAFHTSSVLNFIYLQIFVQHLQNGLKNHYNLQIVCAHQRLTNKLANQTQWKHVKNRNSN